MLTCYLPITTYHSPANLLLHRPTVLIHTLGNRPCMPFVDQANHAVDRRLKDHFTLLGRGGSRVAMHAQIGPATPIIVETHGIGVHAVRTHVLAHHVITFAGLVHLHA